MAWTTRYNSPSYYALYFCDTTLGLSFWVRSDVVPETVLRDHLVVETKIVLHITDPAQAKKLDGKAVNARRKRMAKSWWNHEWVSRQIAMAQYLADGKTEIVIGAIPTEQVRVAATALGTSVSPAINDAALRAFSVKLEALDAVLGLSAAEEMPDPVDELPAPGMSAEAEAYLTLGGAE